MGRYKARRYNIRSGTPPSWRRPEMLRARGTPGTETATSCLSAMSARNARPSKEDPARRRAELYRPNCPSFSFHASGLAVYHLVEVASWGTHDRGTHECVRHKAITD